MKKEYQEDYKHLSPLELSIFPEEDKALISEVVKDSIENPLKAKELRSHRKIIDSYDYNAMRSSIFTILSRSIQLSPQHNAGNSILLKNLEDIFFLYYIRKFPNKIEKYT